MGKYIYLCHQCKTPFNVSAPPGSKDEEETRCPECGSMPVERLPSWAPIGFNLNASPDKWEYACHQCKITFKLPVPRGPSEEKTFKCPECGSMHIERLTALVFQVPLYCG